MTPALRHSLIETASAPYREVDRYAWHFARSKLKCDPAFVTLLQLGLIPQDANLLDLGCGQGLLTAWLLSAQAHANNPQWPEDWPPPPHLTSIHGIELMARDQQRATQALGQYARFTQGDIGSADFGQVDAIVMLDVLHYIDFATQQSILQRAHAALAPGGVLILRIGDAAHGLRHRLSAWYDRMVWKLRGARHSRLFCRTLDDWRKTLDHAGFEVRSVPMHEGLTPANVLLVAKPKH